MVEQYFNLEMLGSCQTAHQGQISCHRIDVQSFMEIHGQGAKGEDEGGARWKQRWKWAINFELNDSVT